MLNCKKFYREKEEWLNQFFEEVSPVEFYRDIFPVGSFEREKRYDDEKANGIVTVFEDGIAQNRIVLDDLKMIDEVRGAEFTIMSPISYFGRNRTSKNARWLYAIAIDLDGIIAMKYFRNVFHQMSNDIIPTCTYAVHSGNGLHLYYVFEKPIPMYHHLHKKLRELKYDLIYKIWNKYNTVKYEKEQIQFQSIFQGFRVVGTQSKLGNKYPVKAYRVGSKMTLDYLNGFLLDQSKAIHSTDYQSDLTLEQAKKKYPEWYERRIEKKAPKGRWVVKRDLYDWWYKKIQLEARPGHRYYCLAVLASYAIKCNIDKAEVTKDALALVPYFDSISDLEHEQFTEEDALAAIGFYEEDYVSYPRAEIERVTGISVPPNKRNYLKQSQHLYLARRRKEDMKAIELPMKNPEGRPSKESIVREWQKMNPNGKPKECIEDTGLSKNTVYKWWNRGEEWSD